MDCILALKGKEYILTASNKAFVRGITVLDDLNDKSKVLNYHNLLLYSGMEGDTLNFSEYLQANVQLYEMKNSVELETKAVANFVRKELADSLRSRRPYGVNLLLAGYDIVSKSVELYFLDNLATFSSVSYACHGYGSYYVLSLLDKYYQQDITLEKGLELLRKCLDEMKTRLPIDFKSFIIKIVDKNGISVIKE
ncbi:proteasome core particle subunit beta 4 [Pneumocystis jirovecii RU7]|uniref:Proteasome subunit beta n=1 Tax=Pneumocystis jirovecii (strain RU7) TaxID=1408657 RepID=A0A0W4ZIM0_PNEJ7|nr:proteasome core particle subunit beta 4 [Pneumocystis jirovecii RU7]KTW28209.1 hypothetical protein T551_02628 [Pneumocystis jirovecii RU7]